jgi:transposase
MIKNEYVKQDEIEMVSIEQLVPQDHLLRQIEDTIDFSFVRERMEPFYCKDNGRPAIDPVVLFKMLFIGYLYGIRSERQLVKEIEVNVAYRWFLHLNLTDKVPHHSTISQNRRRRFNGTDVFRQMFNDLVEMAYDRGFIEGKILYTDSTHLKADANNKKYRKVVVEASTRAYLEDLEQAVNEDRKAHGRASLLPADKNPDDNTLNIELQSKSPNGHEQVAIEIYNIKGQSVLKEVYQSQLDARTYRVPASSLANGIYFCRVTCGKQQATGKFCVIK